MVRQKTGLPLSPYFSAPKLAWMLEHIPAVRQAADAGTLCCGTVDSWLLWNLTRERVHRTDYSNASRTELFNIHTLRWDEGSAPLYGCRCRRCPRSICRTGCSAPPTWGLPGAGSTHLRCTGGQPRRPCWARGCFAPGTAKATYGTGSSVMMQTGDACIEKAPALVTSLAWGLSGRVNYVLEGNLNYTGAVISWLKKDVGLLRTDAESEQLARQAHPGTAPLFVPKRFPGWAPLLGQ